MFYNNRKKTRDNYLITKRKNFSFRLFPIAHEITFLFLGVFIPLQNFSKWVKHAPKK